MDRQSRANAVDAEMLRRGLPESGLAQLSEWWAGQRGRLGEGTVLGHAIAYKPCRWSAIRPWPPGLAERSGAGDAWVSRRDVVDMVRDALAREAWSEAFVATYVWGKGKSGSPQGSGPSVLEGILKPETVESRLAEAVETLRNAGVVTAYAKLRGAVKGLGPAFFTKFLYFADQVLGRVSGPRALILDGRIAGVLRAQAAIVGRELGVDDDGRLASWTWSRAGWTAHRYEIYLTWMCAASQQLSEVPLSWPVRAAPDLLELALFRGGWKPGTE